MLKQLGRLERSRNIIIVGFAGLMAVSLVIFYGPGRAGSPIDPLRNTAVVAKVGSDTITVADVATVRENYKNMFQGRISLAQLGGNESFLNTLISNLVIAQEAKRLGLGASDAELADKIRKQFVDASGQFIGFERYKDSVTTRYGDIQKFESGLRAEIAQEKLKAFISASVNVSDEEVQTEFKRKNSTFNVQYIVVSADKLSEKIQPTDQEMRAYFDAHQTEYRYLEPQRKVRYVFINTEKAGSKLQIPDKDLKAQFDALKPPFNEAGVKVQQILLKVARKDLDAQVEQKAKDLIAKLRGPDGKASEQDFAEAARGNSEDPATASTGGYLPRPFKKNPNKIDGLYDRTADMTVGDISDIPIRYNGNWYILRRGDSVPKTFEQAKPELLVSARNQRSFQTAFQLAQKAQARLQETKDPQKVAQEFAAEANMTPAEMVKETAFVKPGDDIPDVGSNQQFEQTLATLNNKDDVGQSTGIKNGFAIPILVEKKDPRLPDFEEVKSKVADALKRQKAGEQLEQKAKDLLATLSSPDGIKAAGEKEGFDAGTEEDFKLGSTLGTAGANPSLDDAIYALKSGEINKTPIKVNENWVIVGVTKKVDADMAQFEKERDSLKTTLISVRQNQVFEDYVAGVQQRMKQDGRITIYKDVLAVLKEDDEPAAAPGLPPGFNFPSN